VKPEKISINSLTNQSNVPKKSLEVSNKFFSNVLIVLKLTKMILVYLTLKKISLRE